MRAIILSDAAIAATTVATAATRPRFAISRFLRLRLFLPILSFARDRECLGLNDAPAAPVNTKGIDLR